MGGGEGPPDSSSQPAFLGPHTTSQQQAQQKAKSSTKRLGGKREEKYRSWRSVAERGALPPDPRPAGGPGRGLALRAGLLCSAAPLYRPKLPQRTYEDIQAKEIK